MAEAPAIAVVIPVYKEINTVGAALRRVLDCGYQTEVAVVGDGSSDGTREYLKQIENPRVRGGQEGRMARPGHSARGNTLLSLPGLTAE